MYGPHWLRDPEAPRLCSALIISGGVRTKGRRKGPGSGCRDGGPDVAAAWFGVVWTRKAEKEAEAEGGKKRRSGRL